MKQPVLTEGERWTREQLEELRQAGYTPAAAGRFLVAAQRRAGEQRAARPALARQAHRWTAAGALVWLALAAAVDGPFRRRLKSGLAWWGFTGVMLDWHLGMVETEDGEPCLLSAADACTLFRAWLVPVAAEEPAPLVCGLALGTDVLDGALARRLGHPTRFGRDLEGVVDAAFAAAALCSARRHGRLGRSAAAAELGRLVVGALYTAGAYFGRARPPDPALARAARAITPLRGTGLMAAGLRKRRAADALIWTGATASVTRAVRSLGPVRHRARR